MPKQHNYQKELEKHVRKQNFRNARKKVRPNAAPDKPRQRNWDEYADDDWDMEGFYEAERIMPKGHTEQRKEISKIVKTLPTDRRVEGKADEIEVLDDDLTIGRVIEVTSGQCTVAIDGNDISCSVRGSLQVEEKGYSNVVAVGDQVAVQIEADGRGVVEKVLPRKNVLARTASSFIGQASGRRQVVAANLDRVLIVASWREPQFWPELIDRYLIAADRNDLEAVICVNKIDLIEDQKGFETTIKPYRDLGYMILMTSAQDGVGIPNLRGLLTGAVTVLTGMSGVGKSSLLSAVQPGLNLKALSVGTCGKNKNQGRHTTRMATYYPLSGGGAVIDTPGIRDFGLAGLAETDIRHFYPEFTELAPECSFRDCLHLHEPDCAVRAAAGNGHVSMLRYENYTKIMESMAA
jgi:ribosome biogenesis GTPase